MKITEFEINGQVLYLCFNGAAMFDLYDIYGREGSLIDHILPDNKKAFDALCVYMVKMAEQGELVRRYQGFEPQKIWTVRELRTIIAPTDWIRAKLAVRAAIAQGWQMEESKPEKGKKRDLALEEWNKTQKKTKFCSRVAAIFGF